MECSKGRDLVRSSDISIRSSDLTATLLKAGMSIPTHGDRARTGRCRRLLVFAFDRWLEEKNINVLWQLRQLCKQCAALPVKIDNIASISILGATDLPDFDVDVEVCNEHLLSLCTYRRVCVDFARLHVIL